MLSEDDRRPRLAPIQGRRELLRQLPRDPPELLPAREHLDRAGIVLVARIAPQLESSARLDVGGDESLGVVLSGPGNARDVQPPLPGRLPAEVAPAVGIDDLEPDQPDLPAVVRIPVALVVLDVDYHASEASKGSGPRKGSECQM